MSFKNWWKNRLLSTKIFLSLLFFYLIYVVFFLIVWAFVDSDNNLLGLGLIAYVIQLILIIFGVIALIHSGIYYFKSKTKKNQKKANKK